MKKVKVLLLLIVVFFMLTGCGESSINLEDVKIISYDFFEDDNVIYSAKTINGHTWMLWY